jgi:hypothetical protein
MALASSAWLPTTAIASLRGFIMNVYKHAFTKKSTRGVCACKQLLYVQNMNMGKRIEQRLQELQWKRSDLLSRVPDLTVQALSNLIRRDSVRSEWDVRIAEALGVSVMWLVYGETGEIRKHYEAQTPMERQLLDRFRVADNDVKTVILKLLPELPDISRRAG